MMRITFSFYDLVRRSEENLQNLERENLNPGLMRRRRKLSALLKGVNKKEDCHMMYKKEIKGDREFGLSHIT